MKTRKLSLAALTLVSVGLPFQSPRAATVTLRPDADTTLQAAFPNNNFGDGTSIMSGGRRQGGEARGLFRFDIAGGVPAGATIDSVMLTLNVTATPAGGIGSIFELHRALAAWGEGNGSDHGGTPGGAGQATWNVRLGPGTAWGTPGGDFSPTVSASRSIAGNGSYPFASTPQLVGDVQLWLNNPTGNFGWELISQSGNTPASIRRFGSRDDFVNAPVLIVNFTPVPEPGSLAFWCVVGVAGASVLRRKAGPM